MYNRQNCVAIITFKVIEALLLNSEGEPHGIGDRNRAQSIGHGVLRGSHIRNRNFITNIIVSMEAFTARPYASSMHRPMRCERLVIQLKCWPHGLRDCIE